MNQSIIQISHLKKYFDIPRRGLLHAVDDVNLEIPIRKTLGLVGESGCGKTTTGLTIVRLYKPTSGKIFFKGKDIFSLKGKESHNLTKKIQIIFQDPYSSLNPKKTIRQIVSEPFIIHNSLENKYDIEKEVYKLLELTNLPKNILNKFPHELDGGHRQTIGIARALALGPEFIVCDEPISALDVSVQARILNLLMDLQAKLNLSYLFITHDLSVVKHISNKIAVMYLGQVVELAETDEFFNNPLHPYTQALLSAIPTINLKGKKERIILKGDVPSPINPNPGCRFFDRCWKATKECREVDPVLELKKPDHMVACIHVDSKI